MTSNVMYSDTVSLVEDVVQVAVRNDSIDVNAYKDTVYGTRININGCWNIVSTNKEDSELLSRFKYISLSTLQSRKCEELADAELYKGYVEIGKDLPEVEDVAKLLQNLCEEARGVNVARCEIVVSLKNLGRSIERDNGEKAQEVKKFVEVDIGLLGKASLGSMVFSSLYDVAISWSSKEVLRNIEDSFRSTIERLSKTYGLKSLKPYLYGRATIVLDHTATAVLFHEVSHMLDSTYLYAQKLLGYKIGPDELEVYDEPYSHEAPSLRFFDDEGVITRKRMLIENGTIRDLHHTRSTAKTMGSEPGSAYGLFHKPVPFHTVLAVKSGDWKPKEILEDTKRGFYVEGAAMATLEEGYIRFIPEISYTIENGELKEAVKIREIKVPLQNIKSISAISRDAKVRVSIEKSWVVSEMVPMTRLVAYIQ